MEPSKDDQVSPFDLKEKPIYGPPTMAEIKNAEQGKKKFYLYSMLRPLAFIGAVFGIFPLPKFYSKYGPGSFRYCSVSFGHGLIVIILYIVGTGVTMNDLIHGFTKKFEWMEFVLTLVFYSLFIVACSLSLAVRNVTYPQLGKIYQTLKELDHGILSISGKPIKSLERKLHCIFALFLISGVIFVYYQWSTITDQNYFFVAVYLSLHTYIVMHHILLHGVGLCLCVATLYSDLNMKIMRLLDEEYRDQLEMERFRQKLKVISKQHLRVSEFSEEFSCYFSPQLLPIITAFFLNTCYDLFMAWLLLREGGDAGMAGLMILVSTLDIILIYSLAWSVDLQNSYHDETWSILRNWANHFRDEKTSHLIHRFSFQVLNSKPSFSVVGFFNVNREFILSMIGTLASYLVILIQFKESDNSEERPQE